jgi:hypothetical protein
MPPLGRTIRGLSGRGWNQELWASKVFPTAADLDAAVSDRPVVLERVDGHAIVVNDAALKAAGVTVATKDPVGARSNAMRRATPPACSWMPPRSSSRPKYRQHPPHNSRKHSTRRRNNSSQSE